MALVCLKIALTALLAVLLLVLASMWQSNPDPYERVGNYVLAVAMAMLIGGVGIVWAHRTHGRGAAVRLTLSIPILSAIGFMKMFVSPPFGPIMAFAFDFAVIVLCVFLVAAIWAYRPTKR